MPSKTWGIPQLIKSYIVVNEQAEIPAGHKAYIFGKDPKPYTYISKVDWEQFIAGNLTQLKQRIESDIPNTKVVWLRISWDKAFTPYPPYDEYEVRGFYVEAIVENTGSASLTGAEICLIIMALSWLAVIVTLCLTGGWVTWKVIESTPSQYIPLVGIIILVLIGLGVLILFGAKLKIGRFQLGK